MRKVIILLLLLVFNQRAYTGTITLKNGKTVTASILEKTEEFIKVDIEGVGVKYYLDEIESFDENDDTNQQAPPESNISEEKEDSLTEADKIRIENCQEAIKLNPDSPIAYSNLGLIYESLKE